MSTTTKRSPGAFLAVGSTGDLTDMEVSAVTNRTPYPERTTTARPTGVSDPKPDGCPECLTRGHHPRHVGWTLDGRGYYATYGCMDCGHVWWTGWGCEPSGVV